MFTWCGQSSIIVNTRVKMAVNKSRITVTNSLNVSIIMLTFFGIMPYSLISYCRHKVLKLSIFGNIYVIVLLINSVIRYHFETLENAGGEDRDSGKLTILVSLVIIYMEPALMVSDTLLFLINQKRILILIERMERVNQKLIKENVEVNLGQVRRMSIILSFLITVIEIGLVTYNYIFFKDAIWFLPNYLSTLAKVFYVALVFILKQYLNAINQHLETAKIFFEESKLQRKKRCSKVIDTDEMGYLHKEILSKRKMAQSVYADVDDDDRKVVNVIPYDNTNLKAFNNEKSFSIDTNSIFIGDKMDKKIKRICKIHDDISEIAQEINLLFSFQMLLLVAYGFMAITARIYFMYCSLIGQIIPILFRASESTIASSIFLMYSSAKCVVVVLVSYNTKLVAQRTGIYLHKVANAVDEDHLYETINHLSLKLLNHSIRFSACGFFELDMTTIYAITGAITSYIIILIQFNLAALRVKKPIEAAVTNATSYAANFSSIWNGTND